jgi:farnesyl diphosphate synthase
MTNTFPQRLERTAADVEALLDTLLPREETAAAPRLAAAMRHAALGGGKRIRPFFVRETTALCGGDDARALRVGAALECIHCYSLVHDDLPAMDDDALRRGRPTVHVAFDEATAILAGDALQSLAFEIIADSATHPDAAVRAELAGMLAKASGEAGMAGGQMLDMQAEAASERALAQVITIQRLKTGALFRFACEAGAVLAGADETARAALRAYADAIGLAFQVADDILDVQATAEELGKTPGKDAAAGKATFVDLLGLDGARQRARELVDEAIAALAPFGAHADMLRAAARFVIERNR